MKHKSFARIGGLIGAALGLVFLPTLIDLLQPVETQGQTHQHTAPTTTVTYILAWEWGAALPAGNGEGWSVTNNLGYMIHAQRGYLVNRSLELIPCEHDDSPAERVLNRFAPQPAQAGHGATEHDSTRISAPFIESLAQPSTIELETTFGDETAYCQAHYLVAPGIETARNLPSEVNLLDKSLLIEGVYTAPVGDTPIPFTIITNLAWGTVTKLTAVDSQLAVLEAASQPQQIIIRRNLGGMFDNLDFEAMSPVEQSKTILRSLTASTRIIVMP